MELHPRVHEVVGIFLQAADAEAPGLVEALYLTGSVALGDFHLLSSDIDYVAVLRGPPDAADNSALQRAHFTLKRRCPQPNFHGSCVTAADLTDGKVDPVTLRTLAGHPVVCRGPEPVLPPPAEIVADLSRYAQSNLASYWVPLLRRAAHFPSLWSLVAASGFGAVWIVQGISRLHYTLATGDICSKLAAGQYALRTFPAEWHNVIHESLRLRTADLAGPNVGSALWERICGGSLYATPPARRRDVVAFGRMVLDLPLASLHGQIGDDSLPGDSAGSL